MRLPILTYHNIGDAPDHAALPKLYVSAPAFERQCRMLSRLGLRGVSIGEALAGLREGRRGLVALTFDDGYLDNFNTALPILRDYGFTATCYVVAGRIGEYNVWDASKLNVRKPLMTAAQLRMWRAAGNELGSHTLTHPNLTELDAESLQHELVASKAALENLVGAPIKHFCYPYGEESPRVRRAVAAAGYESATSTRRGLARTYDDPYALPRISIDGGKGLLRFALKVATPYAAFGGSGAA